jgi:antitoxin component of MazEF toxin-antitoxin module
MPLSTKVRAQGGSLVTAIPEMVARELGLSSGSEVFWVKDGQGGYRVYPDSEKARKIIDAHEAAISEHHDVFRGLTE